MFRVIRAVIVIAMLGYIIYDGEHFKNEQRAEWAKIEVYHKEAVVERNRILAVQLQNQQTINDHIKAAIDRWRQVGEINPGFKVPHVPEPTLPAISDAPSD